MHVTIRNPVRREVQIQGKRRVRELLKELDLNPESHIVIRLAPAGDMRRVVAAAEGARRFLGMDRVSTQELGALFDFVQWPKPRNFLQTLRNAGRSDFRWLQRVPGSSGYYSVTDQGRREIISEDLEQTS